MTLHMLSRLLPAPAKSAAKVGRAGRALIRTTWLLGNNNHSKLLALLDMAAAANASRTSMLDVALRKMKMDNKVWFQLGL